MATTRATRGRETGEKRGLLFRSNRISGCRDRGNSSRGGCRENGSGGVAEETCQRWKFRGKLDDHSHGFAGFRGDRWPDCQHLASSFVDHFDDVCGVSRNDERELAEMAGGRLADDRPGVEIAHTDRYEWERDARGVYGLTGNHRVGTSINRSDLCAKIRVPDDRCILACDGESKSPVQERGQDDQSRQCTMVHGFDVWPQSVYRRMASGRVTCRFAC